MCIYVIGEVYLLYEIGLWDKAFLKDTIIWFLFWAIALFFESVPNAEHKELSFKKLLKDAIGVFVIFEFVTGFYTFNLVVEFFLLPMVTFLAIGVYMAERSPNHVPVAKFFNGLLIIAGLLLLVYLANVVWSDRSIFSILSLRQLLVPTFLTVLFIPMLYMFALYSVYSQMCWRISRAFKERPDQAKEAKCFVVRNGFLSLMTTKRLGKIIARKIWSVSNPREMNLIFEKFKNPVTVKSGDFVKESITGEIGEVLSISSDFAKIKFPSDPGYPHEMWTGDLEVVSRSAVN